jgi:hypothetical protein
MDQRILHRVHLQAVRPDAYRLTFLWNGSREDKRVDADVTHIDLGLDAYQLAAQLRAMAWSIEERANQLAAAKPAAKLAAAARVAARAAA